MKYMKLGSKPDFFQTDGDNVRYVATELATDVVVNVGDVKFYLHKFPLLSKSARLQKRVATTNDDSDEINIPDIPGGPAAFEICAKFCYGMTVTLSAYNVVATRCAAEYLEMHETVEKGNLIYKVEVFLNSSIFRSWKDSIIVLQTTRSLLPWAEEIKVVSHCLDSIASKASIHTSKVEWSYTYNQTKLPPNNGDPHWNGAVKQQMVPKDWWVEDLCGLQLDLYKRVITIIKTRGNFSADVIGEALNAYTVRKLSGFSKGMIQGGDVIKNRSLVETVIHLLPTGSVSCRFLLKLFKAATLLECGEMEKCELISRIGRQLEEATVSDLVIHAPTKEPMIYEVNIVQRLIEEFVTYDRNAQIDPSITETEFQEIRSPRIRSDTSEVTVAKLVDGYLTEVSRDPNLPVSKFVILAEMVSSFSRPTHDGLYRAIDMYLKEHPGISKSERKRMCNLMDCRKLSADACMHAVQNERLPLRVVVQVLFFEQIRASASGGNSTPDLQGPIRALLPGGSHGSSSSTTTNTEEDWDAVPTAEEIKALKGELSTLRLRDVKGGVGNDRTPNDGATNNSEKVAASKVKGLLVSNKIFSKLWSSKEKNGEISSSSTSESPGSTPRNAEETKSTRSRSRRHSVY